VADRAVIVDVGLEFGKDAIIDTSSSPTISMDVINAIGGAIGDFRGGAALGVIEDLLRGLLRRGAGWRPARPPRWMCWTYSPGHGSGRQGFLSAVRGREGPWEQAGGGQAVKRRRGGVFWCARWSFRVAPEVLRPHPVSRVRGFKGSRVQGNKQLPIHSTLGPWTL